MQNQFSTTSSFKILIIRMSSIGDIVLTTPVLRLLKQKFPGSKIDFVIKKQFAPVLSDNPFLNRLLIFDRADNKSLKQIRNEIVATKYDIIFDLHKNFRSYYLTNETSAGKIARYKKGVWRRFLFVKFKIRPKKKLLPVYQRYLACLKFLNIHDDFAGPDFFINDSLQTEISTKYSHFLNEHKSLLIGVAPGASFKTKRWTPEGFSEVINRLIEEKNAGIILFGNEADRNITTALRIKNKTRAMDVTGELSIMETTALLNHCHIVLTNDTGLMHIATALKKKVVAIFGSTTEDLGFFPYNTEHIVVQNDKLNCRPCSHIGRHECPKKHFKCMKDISSQQVYEAVLKMIDQ